MLTAKHSQKRAARYPRDLVSAQQVLPTTRQAPTRQRLPTAHIAGHVDIGQVDTGEGGDLPWSRSFHAPAVSRDPSFSRLAPAHTTQPPLLRKLVTNPRPACKARGRSGRCAYTAPLQSKRVFVLVTWALAGFTGLGGSARGSSPTICSSLLLSATRSSPITSCTIDATSKNSETASTRGEKGAEWRGMELTAPVLASSASFYGPGLRSWFRV